MLLWNTCEACHETKYEFSQSPTVDSATNGNIGSKNFDFGNLALITGWISRRAVDLKKSHLFLSLFPQKIFMRKFCHKPWGLGERNILYRNRDIFFFSNKTSIKYGETH